MVPIIGDLRTQAIELQQNPCWIAVRGEINNMITAQTEDLLNTTEPAECVRLQERIKSLRFCATLPKIIAEREES
jgi:hypothetical protein